MADIERDEERHRIIVFGSAGMGKSSLVNLLLNLKDPYRAKVGNDVRGVTFETNYYDGIINEELYTLIDTAGLNEATTGTVPSKESFIALRDLLASGVTKGFSLAIFVVKGKWTSIAEVNYDLFVNHMLRPSGIPCLLFYNGLDDEENIDAWLGRAKEHLAAYTFTDVVAGSAWFPTKQAFDEVIKDEREQTYVRLVKAIVEHKLPKPVKVTKPLTILKALWNCFCRFFKLAPTFYFVDKHIKRLLIMLGFSEEAATKEVISLENDYK